ncbi:MAG: translation elongation factor Ts [Patescibacteria group bacterium]|jgi:elongation factor Ts
MSDFSAIKQLREKTGAGMVDCQKALEEAGGSFDQAVELLRKKGLEKAGKKAERSTKEGLIAIAQDGAKTAVVGLACETDFVSRNQDFVAAVEEFAKELLTADLLEFKAKAEDKINKELIIKIGENIKLAAAEVVSGPVVGIYLHSNKKAAAAVVLDNGSEQLAIDLAMQVVAMAPKYLSPAEVPAEIIDKEKEIYREQLQNENKPAAVWDKIIAGKLAKFYSEVCLLNQAYIKDDQQTVEQLLGSAKVVKFSHYQI